MAERYLVDTSAWIDAFRGEAKAVKRVSEPVLEGRALLCGPVLAELLQGLREPKRQKELLGRLNGAEFVEMQQPDWIEAGLLSAELAGRGASVPLTDCLIAALAKRHKLTVLTRDKDYKRFHGLAVDLF